MSHSKHLNSLSYLETELERQPCPKNKCKGVLIPVIVRYPDQPQAIQEYECCKCGKVVGLAARKRYEKWKEQHEKRQQNRRNK